MNSVDKVIKIAEKEIGYLEKKNSSNLDDKTANAGSANYTKYGRDMCKITTVYGTHAAWCDCFVDWCFVQAYGVTEAEKLLGGFSGYTPTSAGYFKNRKQWHTTPKVGDIIFFKNSTRICHTGIVIAVESGKVFTIEGNTSAGTAVIPNGGGVHAKSYTLTNSSIAGYGRPAYDEKSPTSESSSTTNTVDRPEHFGIDISSYQGTIDGKKVAKQVEYVILRCTTKNNQKDIKFEEHYKNCINNNIPIGVYKFSYAKTLSDAKEEAEKVIEALQGKDIDCGVWYDLEWSEQIPLGKDQITKIAMAFIETMEKAGYKTGIYCNRNWFLNYIDTKKIDRPVWIARYPASDKGKVREDLRPNLGELIWQYSSKGSIDGISGNIDLNTSKQNLKEYFTKKSQTQVPSAPITQVVTPTNNTLIKNVITANTLHVRKGPSTAYAHVKYLKKNDVVNVLKCQNGWYYIGDGWISGKYVSAKTGIITASALNIRSLPSTSGKILGVYKKNQKVKLLAKDGKWFLTEKGWISGNYIK